MKVLAMVIVMIVEFLGHLNSNFLQFVWNKQLLCTIVLNALNFRIHLVLLVFILQRS